MLTHGSLFAGIGGFDLGFDRAGMTTAWQVEIDANCNAVLEHHWPEVARYGDIRNVGADLRAVDVISGGFPCQDLSVAGRRAGLAGDRSGLWFEFYRVLTELRPSWAIIENVPGLLSSNGGRDFAVILSGLAKLGYGVCWRVLNAQYFGVAQRRRRVFIIGSLGDGRAAQVLFECESGGGDPPQSGKAGEEVAGSIGMCSPSGGFRQDLDNMGAYIYEVHGGSKRKDRPAGGFYVRQLETSKPLDTGGLNPNCAQGGQVVVPPLKAQSGKTGKGDGAPLVAFDWQAGGGGKDQSFRGKSRSYIVRRGEYAQIRKNAIDAISGSFGVR